MEVKAETTSHLRFAAESPDKQQAVFVYAIKADGKIELEKLADLDKELFQNLGTLVDTRKEYSIFPIFPRRPKKIEKLYRVESLGTKLIFQSKGKYGYILVWQGIQKDSPEFNEILGTFHIHIPFLRKILDWFTGLWSGALGWIAGIIVTLISGGILFIIGMTGYFISDGVRTRHILREAKKEAAQKGYILTEKWHQANKKSMLSIVMPTSGWLIVYLILFFVLPLKTFLWCLLVLILPILGAFGILFGPSTEVDDYLPF